MSEIQKWIKKSKKMNQNPNNGPESKNGSRLKNGSKFEMDQKVQNMDENPKNRSKSKMD